MNLWEKHVGKSVPSHFHWKNEPAEWMFDEGSNLLIVAPQDADFFRNPNGDRPRATAPFLYTEIDGDFEVTTRVKVAMQSPGDSACLMIWVDDSHWCKLCYEFVKDNPVMVSVVTNGFSDDCISETPQDTCPMLRVRRKGNTFAFHYSTHSENTWHLLRYFHSDVPRNACVGVVAQCPTGHESQAIFEMFDYERLSVDDIRG